MPEITRDEKWFVERSKHTGELVVKADKDTTLAVLCGPDEIENHRNSHLFAAGPELFEQLAALTVQLEEAHLHVPPGVLSALAKARGEEA